MFHRSHSFLLAVGVAVGVFFAGSTFLLAASATADSTPAVSAKETPWFPTVEFGGKVGSKRHVWEMDATLPLLQDEDSLVFFDVRGRMDDDGSEEGNLGLGWRRIVHGGEGIFGLYGFYDILHSSYHNTYNQGTLGAEYLWRNVEIRGNAYIPERGTRSTSGGASGANIVGNQIFVMSGGGEEALPGFDVEAGLLVPGTDDLWVRAGLFHFSADDDLENVTGPRLSAEWGIDLGNFFRGTELTLGGEWQDDDIRGSQSFATARVRIPLGPAPTTRAQAPSWQYTRMQEKIRRDIDIVVAQGAGAPVAAVDPQTGEEYDGIYFADGDSDIDSGAAGTFEDPTDLDTALDLAGENGVVVALGAAGDLVFGDVTVPDGAKLLGGGATLMVSAGGAETALSVPGSRPTLVSDDGIELEDSAGDILLKGFDLTSDGDGISGYDNYDVVIDDVSVVAGGGEGGHAVVLREANGSVTVRNSDLEASTYGVYVTSYGDSVDVLIEDNVIDGSDAVRLVASSSGSLGGTVEGNDIDGDSDGIRVNAGYAGAVDLAIRDNVVSAGASGINLDVSSSGSISASITGNTLSGGTGVTAEANYTSAMIDLVIQDNTISGLNGIDLSASASSSTSAYLTADIIGNDITVKSTGVQVDAYYGGEVDVLIEDNTIKANQGVYLSASSSGSVSAEIVGNAIDAGEVGVGVQSDYDAYVYALIEDNTISADYGVSVSASSSGSASADIIGNTIDAEDTGIEVDAGYDGTVYALIEDNTITAGDGVFVSASSSASASVDIIGNTIDAEDTGIEVDAGYDGTVYALIEDNTISADYGVSVSASSSSGYISASITGNTIDAEETGINVYSYYEASVDVLIEDNVIDAGSEGVYLSASASSSSSSGGQIDAEILDNEITADGTGISGYAYYGGLVDVLIEDNTIDAGGFGIYLSGASSSSSSSSSSGYVSAEITGNDIDADSDDISLNGPMSVNACPPTLNSLNGGASVSISGSVSPCDD